MAPVAISVAEEWVQAAARAPRKWVIIAPMTHRTRRLIAATRDHDDLGGRPIVAEGRPAW